MLENLQPEPEPAEITTVLSGAFHDWRDRGRRRLDRLDAGQRALRLHGVRVIVLARDAEPTRIVRSLGLHARGIEIIDQRGLLERLLELGQKYPLRGSFAGILRPTPGRVITITDAAGAQQCGVRMSRTAGPGASASSGQRALRDAGRQGERGELVIPVHAVFDLARASAAHQASESRRAHGKIVITVPPA